MLTAHGKYDTIFVEKETIRQKQKTRTTFCAKGEEAS